MYVWLDDDDESDGDGREGDCKTRREVKCTVIGAVSGTDHVPLLSLRGTRALRPLAS